MAITTLFITPPFTQLNTPYPATAYLKGFFNTVNLKAYQADLGMEVILDLFSSSGVKTLFKTIEHYGLDLSDNAVRMIHLQEHYINAIDPVIAFLQDKNPTLAYRIAKGDYLPEASRFGLKEEADLAFGTMGIRDKARHFATLFLEDLSDLIRETVDPNFGFSRYAEQLGMSATEFDELHEELQLDPSFTDHYLLKRLQEKLEQYQPQLVGISVPFPGNLYSAFKCAQYIKQNFPDIKTSLGGGFPNTELRSLSDPTVFDYFDFVTLDDGEQPLLSLVDYLDGNRPIENLKRTFLLQNGKVKYMDNKSLRDIPFKDLGCPDYTDLDLGSYLSVLEIANPMHRLWSDGCWNKLTMAHGCYWKKCSFCDISLDYIETYTPLSATTICDRMEQLMEQTGQNGFHFVDEAAPPSIMRDVAIEILRRDLAVVWWTNIRFEERFTKDLCQLLKTSGCIAVSGGLEVASDRLLEKMEKGVSVSQVARVTQHFTQAGIMVHAYLMYGFPTQTEQETIDSLEMVRQLFQAGIIQSGFWHRFAMTAHSPVGLQPEKYGVVKVGPEQGGFAYNDLAHEDPTGANPTIFSIGLKTSLLSYMRNQGFDKPLQSWFEDELPPTTIPENHIATAINKTENINLSDKSKILWIGNLPAVDIVETENSEEALFEFHDLQRLFSFTIPVDLAETLDALLEQIHYKNEKLFSIKNAKDLFNEFGEWSLEDATKLEAWKVLRENGLLVL